MKTVFSYPGEQIAELYNEIEGSGIKNVMVRDERGAGFMADGYARITNYLGVCLATAGPGSTNLTTPIANAYKDNSSVLAITGRCQRKYIGKNYFQEINMDFLNFYKGYFVDKADINYVVNAFNDCLTNKKPVQLNIPADLYKEEVKDINIDAYINISDDVGYDVNNVDVAAKKPLFLIGQGIFGTLSYKDMLKISKILKELNCPIATTFPARGVISEEVDNCIGLVGRRGDLKSLLEADKIINIGSSLSYNTYVESVREKLLNKTENIHLKPKNIKELKEFFENLDLKNNNWINKNKNNKKFSPSGDYSNKINEIIENVPKDAIIVTDAGKHTVFTCLLKTCVVPRNIISSHSFGSMGFGLPASIGVKFGTIDFNIDKEVVLISGDGGFLMNIEELQVVSEYGLKILMVVMKNNGLAEFCKIKNPNFNKIADAFGIDNCYIEKADEISSEIKNYLKKNKPLLMVVETENEPLPKPNM
ncbi:thiamine pyrophosphate-binding protein [Methanocaldococcus fervens]|uniref:Thiamine pyrophosphate protein domain protein TPP-binding n=1 Tax=Methanocaldococcus fervens (strain DSM 4213 / JCM 15782 / AG86) TaxID=573064 RepID=C7P890_METFA|nr:thiamine pyrophosphate protein domain protein TPP-binding [Methanocaldococcus fervens AG86]